MTQAILGPNEDSRSLEEIYAAIEMLQQLGGIENWIEQRAHAEQLLQEWLDQPDAIPKDQELPPIDHLAEWLWDQLEPLQEVQTWRPAEEDAVPESLVADVNEWVDKATNILIKGWQQFERFQLAEYYADGNKICLDGDLAEEGNLLWANYDYLDPLTKQNRYWEVSNLWIELERHIDPDGPIHKARIEERDIAKSNELRKKGDHYHADLWLLPKDQWERPDKCSKEDWANIIKPYNRRNWDEPLKEFLDRVQLARLGLCPGREKTATEALNAHQNDAHTKIRSMVEVGASATEIQELINQQGGGYHQTGLAKFADQCRLELERRQDLLNALEDLLLRGAPPAINLADYVPANWLPMFRILRKGLKFSDEAIVMTVMAGVAAMLPPCVRIRGWSMVEITIVWLFHIGTSGTAKSVLLSMLINKPMGKPMAMIDSWNDREKERRKTASEAGDELPQYRKRNLIYTAPTTQGIRADLAEHGEEVPGLLVRDELSGWLKQMAKEDGASVGDVEFWLSSYDGAYSNDVFADAKKSREVRNGKLAVIGGIQPKVFLEQLEAGNANGFNSRPLFVHLPRHKRELIQPDEQSERLTDQLGELYLAALEDSNPLYVLSGEAEETFLALFNQLEELSLQANSEEVEALWAKGPGQVLRVAAAVHFIRVATGQEDLVERGFVNKATVVSSRSLQLAANLVMAGKTRAVELHERAANPMLDRADRMMEIARKLQGKAGGKGVTLSSLRKGWPSRSRPTLEELKQIATMLQSRGLVQLLDGGKELRVVR